MDGPDTSRSVDVLKLFFLTLFHLASIVDRMPGKAVPARDLSTFQVRFAEPANLSGG